MSPSAVPAVLMLALVSTAGCRTGGGVQDKPGGAGRAGSSGLPTPPGPGGVPRPTGTAGALTVLDWAGFKAAVSYTFDDTNQSQIAHYRELQALGVRMTFYLVTGKPEADDATWLRAVKDGHELGNHTMSHRPADDGADVDAGAAFLRARLGVTAYTMASPFGSSSYPPLAASRYLINRGVVNGLIGPNDATDPFNIFCWVPPPNATAAMFDAQVDAARAAGRWRTVLVHGFHGGSDGAYQPVDVAEFVAGVNHAKALGDVWIDSVVNVGAYWRAQKMLSGVTPSASGTSQTWTWALPEHFPPGRHLRVKVDGGTLTQGGRALAWDDHGYYEIALDAGSLTLAP